MKVLGIETSCDETAAAIVEDGRKLISNVVTSQIDIHKEYGGVVPEIAARSHIEAINPVINRALSEADLGWDDIDAISVTNGPGLGGSLLVGTLAARTLALTKDKPLYAVNHVTGHVFANFLLDEVPQFPMLALIVSGGHTQLVLFKSYTEYALLGQTQDDAVGEAYDKVAKILGLSYPGGPSIENSANANTADSTTQPLRKYPKARLQAAIYHKKNENLIKFFNIEKTVHNYNFSFSGLKTAVLRDLQKFVGKDHTFPSFEIQKLLTEEQVNHFAASFNHVAAETLVEKTMLAFAEFSPKSVVIAGGVAANKELRRQLKEALPIDINYAPINLCTDNAAMIATLGYYTAQNEEPISPHELKIEPNLKM